MSAPVERYWDDLDGGDTVKAGDRYRLWVSPAGAPWSPVLDGDPCVGASCEEFEADFQREFERPETPLNQARRELAEIETELQAMFAALAQNDIGEICRRLIALRDKPKP